MKSKIVLSSELSLVGWDRLVKPFSCFEMLSNWLNKLNTNKKF